MRLSVVICTWNRCQLLRQTLEQMTKLAIPAGLEWEVLGVNNKCTDATDEVLAEFAGRLPLRRLYEGQAGKSHALNLAMREAQGEYLVYTDDDVLTDAHWLAEYDQAFRRWPQAALFGGPVEPWFAGTPPRWLEEALPIIESAYAVRRIAGAPAPIEPRFVPFGANLAIRKQEQLRFPFDPAFGPRVELPAGGRAGVKVGGEESMVLWKMLEAGCQGWWVPGARVRHYLAQERQTSAYLRDFYFGHGVLLGRRALERTEGVPRSRSMLWLDALAGDAKYAAGKLLGRPTMWVKGLKKASIGRGKLAALRERGRSQAR